MHAAISFLQHCVSCIWRLHLGHHHHHRHHHLHYIIIIIITIEYVVDWLYLHIAPWPVAFFLQHTRLHFCTTHKIAQLHLCTAAKKHCNKTQINANNTLDKKNSQNTMCSEPSTNVNEVRFLYSRQIYPTVALPVKSQCFPWWHLGAGDR